MYKLLHKQCHHTIYNTRATAMQFCPLCDNKLSLRTFMAREAPGASTTVADAATTTTGTNSCQVVMHCRNCTFTKLYDASEIREEALCMCQSTYTKEHPLYWDSLMNDFTPHDMTLPRSMDIPCPECSKKSSDPVEVVRIRYDDQNERYLYMCCKCLTRWRMPSYQTTEILNPRSSTLVSDS